MRIKYKDNGYILCFLLCFILSYLVLLKSDYFPADFLPYTEIYDGTYGEINNIEPAFLYLTRLFHYLNFPYIFFAMLVCALCLSWKIKYARKIIKDSYIYLFLYVYVSFYVFLHEMTQLRIAIAVTMCYVSVYYYFYKNCIKHALPWMVFAFLFLYSALLLFMSLFIYSYRRLLIVIIGFVICMSFLNVYADTIALYLPNEKIVNYLYSISSSLDNRNDLAIFNLNNIIFLSIFILIFYLSRYIKLNDNEAKFIKYVQCSGILAFCIFFLASGVPVIAYRTAELLRIFYPMALVLILSHIKNNNMRYFIAVIIVILSGLMLFITLRAVSIVGQGL